MTEERINAFNAPQGSEITDDKGDTFTVMMVNKCNVLGYRTQIIDTNGRTHYYEFLETVTLHG